MNAQDYQAPASVNRVQSGRIACGRHRACWRFLAQSRRSEKFYHAYLFSYMWVLGLTLGSLGIADAAASDRAAPGESSSAVRWKPRHEYLAGPADVRARRFRDEVSYSVQRRRNGLAEFAKDRRRPLVRLISRAYLTTGGFLIRAVIYFASMAAAWCGFSTAGRGSRIVNREDRALRRRFKTSGRSGNHPVCPGHDLCRHRLGDVPLAALGLDDLWISFSSAGQAISVDVVDDRRSWCCWRLPSPTRTSFKKRHLHDLGKLLFAFNMLWAYFDFSQLLIIWSGNQPEEISLLPDAAARRLGRRCGDCAGSSLCDSVPAVCCPAT